MAPTNAMNNAVLLMVVFMVEEMLVDVLFFALVFSAGAGGENCFLLHGFQAELIHEFGCHFLGGGV
jgi:hypothetical protein